MNNEELLKEFDRRQKELRDEFIARLEDNKKEFELDYPKDRETLFYISNVGADLNCTTFLSDDEGDRNVFEHGLYFKTKEEAEQFLKERRLLFKISKWAEIQNRDWRPDWSDYAQDKYTIYYDGEDDELLSDVLHITNGLTILPAFKTKEIAQKCIEEFGDEIKEVLL